jgi:hypothetical protein
LEEKVGFEPTVGHPTSHFECDAFDHSAISPGELKDHSASALAKADCSGKCIYDQSKIGSEKEAINAQRGLAYSWRLRHRFKGLKRGILEVRFEL